jgi:hypothetical protein
LCAALPAGAGFLGDDEELAGAETWQPKHGAPRTKAE